MNYNSEQEKTISESKIWKHYKSLEVIFVYVYAITRVKKRTHKHIQYGMVRKMRGSEQKLGIIGSVVRLAGQCLSEAKYFQGQSYESTR